MIRFLNVIALFLALQSPLFGLNTFGFGAPDSVADGVNVALKIDALNKEAEGLLTSDAARAAQRVREAMQLAITQDDNRRLAVSTIQLGVIYRNLGQTSKALDAFFDALNLAERFSYKELEADALHKIGVTYLLVNEFKDALEFGLREERIWMQLNNEEGKASVWNFLGLVYLNLKRYDESYAVLTKALELSRKSGDPGQIYKPLVNLGDLFLRTNRPKEALPYITESLEMSRLSKNRYGEAVALQKKAGLYKQLGLRDSSEKMLLKSLETAENLGALAVIRNNYRDLAALNEEMGDFKTSLHFYRKYVSLEDSMLSEITKRKIAETVARYEIEKKEQENILLRRIASDRERWLNIVLAAAVSIAILTLVLFVLYRRQREMVKTLRHLNSRIMLLNDEVQAQKDALESQNLVLSEINRKKDRFFSIMAHDVRASFAGVVGYAEMLNADLDELSPSEVKSMSANILRGTRTVNGLFENLLQWSRLELNAVQTEFTDIHVAATLQTVASLFDVSMERKDISLHTYIPNDVIVHTDEYILNTVLRNVLSNAIKFSHPGGKIHVSAVKEPDGTLLLVKDEGVGIPAELLEKIFSNDAGISRPGTKNEQGSGLGMHVCKRLCDTVGIGLQIESEEGRGTLIRLSIPRTPQMEEKK